MPDEQIALARLLISRLERLSVDSYWAHRSSGLRGSLLRCLEQIEAGDASPEALSRLDQLITRGFDVLTRGAREIRTLDGR